MHRAPGLTSRRVVRYLLPLTALTVLGLVFGRSLLGSAPDGASASASGTTASHGVSTTTPTTAATTPATTATAAAPKRNLGVQQGTITATTRSPRIKNVTPRRTAKKSKRSVATSTPTGQDGSDDGAGDDSASTPATEIGFAAEVLDLANAERKQAGCGPLTLNSKLNTAAQAHSADMATNNFFSHSSQDGRTPFDRITAAGYSFGAAAENIAAGGTTAAATMKQWMNSPGHRANILNCTYVNLGVGYAKGVNAEYSDYWTQDFGKPL